MSRDTILLSEFLPATQTGLSLFVEETMGFDACEILRGSIDNWALLFFKLRKAEDRPEWFPSGKWATIQRLEQMLNEVA